MQLRAVNCNNITLQRMYLDIKKNNLKPNKNNMFTYSIYF